MQLSPHPLVQTSGKCHTQMITRCQSVSNALFLAFDPVGHPGAGTEPQFLLVHARPFMLSYEPDSVNPWCLTITTNRQQAALDGTHEVIGQVWIWVSGVDMIKCHSMNLITQESTALFLSSGSSRLWSVTRSGKRGSEHRERALTTLLHFKVWPTSSWPV